MLHYQHDHKPTALSCEVVGNELSERLGDQRGGGGGGGGEEDWVELGDGHSQEVAVGEDGEEGEELEALLDEADGRAQLEGGLPGSGKGREVGE